MIHLFFFLILGLHADIPHWAVLQVNPSDFDQSVCQADAVRYQDTRNQCSKNPAEYGGPDECNKLMKPFANYICHYADGQSAVNSGLAKVDASIELLFVRNKCPNQIIDFNKLPSQMIVVLDYSLYGSSSKILSPNGKAKLTSNSNSSALEISQVLSNKPLQDETDVQIVGNISEKVSSLILSWQTFQIVDSDLNVDYFVAETAEFNGATSPNKIVANRYISEISHVLPTDNFSPKYSGYLIDYDKSITEITLQLCENQIEIYLLDLRYDIGFNFDEPLDLILHAQEITFNFTESFLKNTRFDIKLNLTILKYTPHLDPLDSMSYLATGRHLLEKENIVIHTNGDTSKFTTSKPDITLTYDSNSANVDSTELNNIATVKTAQPFEFKTNWKEEDDDGPNIGLIVGVTVACVVVVAVLVIVVIIFIRKRRQNGVI